MQNTEIFLDSASFQSYKHFRVLKFVLHTFRKSSEKQKISDPVNSPHFKTQNLAKCLYSMYFFYLRSENCPLANYDQLKMVTRWILF